MYGLVLMAAVAPGPTDAAGNLPVAEQMEAQAFRMSAEVVRLNWSLTCRHPALMRDEVVGWNTAAVFDAWVADCDWRRSCWCKLDDVLGCESLPVGSKLRALVKLRELLGDEDYYAGRMPSPLPHYKTGPKN